MELKNMRARMLGGVSWNLQQAWLKQPQSGFCAGKVWFGCDDQDLLVVAQLDDANIFTQATGFNEDLYKLGDTLEIFIEKENQGSYLELHVAPNGVRSQMEWTRPSIEQVRRGLSRIEDFKIADPKFFRAEVTCNPNSWEVLAMIPLCHLVNLSEAKLPTLRVSISRYDYSFPGTDPVISSTSSHTKEDFHRVDEWRNLDLNSLKP